MAIPSNRLTTICKTIRAYIHATDSQHPATAHVQQRLISALDCVIVANFERTELTPAQHGIALHIAKIFASAAAPG